MRPGRGSAEFERQDATELAEAALGRKLTPSEVSSYWTGQAIAYALSQPGDWLRLMLRKAALFVSALELSRAAGLEDADLSEAARHALRIAGDRALALNAWAGAAELFGRAVTLCPEDDRDRPELLLSYGSALLQLADDRAGEVLCR